MLSWPFFLRWLYFCNVTFENPVSLSDLMFTHLFTSSGAHQVSIAHISGNSSRLVATEGSSCCKAPIQNSLHYFPGSWASSPAQHPHHRAEEWKQNIMEQNTEEVLERTGSEQVGQSPGSVYTRRESCNLSTLDIQKLLFLICLCSLSECY